MSVQMLRPLLSDALLFRILYRCFPSLPKPLSVVLMTTMLALAPLGVDCGAEFAIVPEARILALRILVHRILEASLLGDAGGASRV